MEILPLISASNNGRLLETGGRVIVCFSSSHSEKRETEIYGTCSPVRQNYWALLPQIRDIINKMPGDLYPSSCVSLFVYGYGQLTILGPISVLNRIHLSGGTKLKRKY